MSEEITNLILRREYLSKYHAANEEPISVQKDRDLLEVAVKYIDDFVRNDYHGDRTFNIQVNGEKIFLLEYSARIVKAQVINVLKDRPYINTLKNDFSDILNLENWQEYYSELGNF